METRNIIFVVGLLLAGGLLFFVITSAVDDSVYMMTVDKAVSEQAEHAGQEIKVQGNVVPGSIIVKGDDKVSFELTKNGETVDVFYTGPRPDTFKDCADVIVTGKLSSERSFDAVDMIAKCPSKYDDLPGGCDSRPVDEGTAANAGSESNPKKY
ncbi:MAG: hypothetical protein AUK47_09290 [Deltaproteobacteria bacterium CG2_30_63_29]|nr:MAG: hypothetical protein AUK47_09290 [Deltaproteobacteria bacterium CG2_30_63_29]PJB37507.1 MAG: hypothetical protein CO108_20940 [Deltaproteobacteria bacterium CG_4_9_14_3_um_filter_63_12]